MSHGLLSFCACIPLGFAFFGDSLKPDVVVVHCIAPDSGKVAGCLGGRVSAQRRPKPATKPRYLLTVVLAQMPARRAPTRVNSELLVAGARGQPLQPRRRRLQQRENHQQTVLASAAPDGATHQTKSTSLDYLRRSTARSHPSKQASSPLVAETISHLDSELEGYAATLRLEEINRKLRTGDVVPEERLRYVLVCSTQGGWLKCMLSVPPRLHRRTTLLVEEPTLEKCDTSASLKMSANVSSKRP